MIRHCLLNVVVLVACHRIRGDEDYASGEWRKSLNGPDSCWTDPTCTRVMNVVHGGDWNLTFPYDSLPAFQKTNSKEADAVKGDFRISKDNIGMVMHSSPVEIWESLDCFNELVEEHTAEENSQCHMEITDITFSTVPEVLAWADGVINFMFCVKETADIPRAITTLLENNATNRAFLEISVDEMLGLVEDTVPHWEEVYYVINFHTAADMDRMLDTPANVRARTFLFEFNDWSSWDSEELSAGIKKVKSYGIRTFAATRDSSIGATVDNHMAIYDAGFDVVYTYNVDNAVIARVDVNTANGISPP
mmetsp:Transcript_29569/g.54716  ORF Transcript_29569/g.54716 Transcript_29569/m.54716 type:complete len:306 (-) Transcript_29569:147-1064(-)